MKIESKRKYWRSIAELRDNKLTEKLSDKEFSFSEEDYSNNFINGKTSRRDFIKLMGFSTAAATLSACKGKVIHSIPYTVHPESIIPGIPNYYATTMFDGFDLRSVLVKTREGRPIKIDENNIAKYFNTTSARVQASLLSLYDNERLKEPHIYGKKVSWKELDIFVNDKFSKITKNGKQIVILTSSLPSPSTKKLIWDFSKKYPNTRTVIYDSISSSDALDASEEIFGFRGFPYYDISETELIISFNADFLGDWIPGMLEKSYSKRREPKLNMLRHIQIESNMTISGANADIRIPHKPSTIKRILFDVYNILIYKKYNNNILAQKIANEIKNKASKATIFADGDKESYSIAYMINKYIKSRSLLNGKFILTKESNNKSFDHFINDLNYGHIGAVLIYQTDPLYSLPINKSLELEKGLKNKTDLNISFSIKENKTSNIMDVWAPTNHWLESWGDTNPITGMYTLMQPTIQPIFNTRQFQDSILIWQNFKENKSSYMMNYYNYLKKFWEENILPNSNVESFNIALFNGVVEIKNDKLLLNNIKNTYKINIDLSRESKKNFFELNLYTKIGIGDGNQFNNPWLQELPDPITRTTWDNYITISQIDAEKIGLKNWYVGNGAMNGNMVNIIANNIKIKNVPVYIQPGQAIGSIGLALGYGNEKFKIKKQRGINAYSLYENFNIIQYNVKIEKIENQIHEFACVQLQNTMAGRNSIARETNIKNFFNKPKNNWNKEEKINTYKGKLPINKITLWKESKNNEGHHFNLSIDLNSCIGCGACVISCNVENNIPVVGKEEIRKSRDMHWLRIDRYYSSLENSERLKEKNLSEDNMFSEPEMYNYLLTPEYNPKVIFQPIMCQHCNNAPCETVCPVSATSHGTQGQNMMAYNRCVGTRYCANNCPYKVRRFNWFNYVKNEKFDFHMNNDIGRMVLNPDVVVRSRGVMEKCSMCIQMTQSVILEAKKSEVKVEDKDFQTACTKACPTNAIIFGDINDENSEVSKKIKEDRSYKLLDFIGTRPNVFYQVKIRNSEEVF